MYGISYYYTNITYTNFYIYNHHLIYINYIIWFFHIKSYISFE